MTLEVIPMISISHNPTTLGDQLTGVGWSDEVDIHLQREIKAGLRAKHLELWVHGTKHGLRTKAKYIPSSAPSST
jgi:hypothetical protein